MPEPHVIVLGAGPAGVGAAHQLARHGKARVTVLEQRDVAGGNAGSFEWQGQRLDYGSHRLHPACDPDILADVRGMLGEDLVERPRHGRIRLRGRWIHFPLKPVDLLLRLDRRFALGALADAATRFLPRGAGAEATFADVLRSRLGGTICESFYFPYARKIWGREPEQLSATQARRRVAANSFAKLARKVLGQLPGVKPVGFTHFYYPRRGYGAISEAYAEAAMRLGADIRFGRTVVGLGRREGGWAVRAETRAGGVEEVTADYIWSTVPISILARAVSPPPAAEVLTAAERIRYRSMILVYLALETERYTEFDAHYFPGQEVAMTRMSEPKNYAADGSPAGRTTLCAELPCEADDELWNLSDEDLAVGVARDLDAVGLPAPEPRIGVHVRRLRFAYPVYEIGYEEHFGVLDAWASALPSALSFGRQGLFAHDNTHHALAMAYAAVACLGPNGFDRSLWADYRQAFEQHVVED
jgi:protoporphyrinogen oxidase